MRTGSGPAGGPGSGSGRKPDRERVYNGADRKPAQNLDTAYRSRWAVHGASGRRREQPGSEAGQMLPVQIPPVELSPVDPPLTDTPARDALVTDGPRRPIDLGPLMRLAHESCWARLFNRPRRSAIADA
jgi:hypothetical protein